MNEFSVLLEGIRSKCQELLGVPVKIERSSGDPEAPGTDLNGFYIVAVHQEPWLKFFTRKTREILFALEDGLYGTGLGEKEIYCYIQGKGGSKPSFATSSSASRRTLA